jgi:EmrB/QacA subfamily drug resistance transporter
MTTDDAAGHPVAPRAWIASALLTAPLTPLNSTMIAVALPGIAAAFGVSGAAVTTWLVTSYLIVNIALVPSAGKLGDLLGRRRALGLGQGMLALGALIGGTSPAFAGVVAGRILMAVGGAVVIPAVMAMLRSAYAPERRPRLFARLGALMGAAAAVGPVLGGILTARLGWQAIFLVNAPLLGVAVQLARRAPATAPRVGRLVRPAWRRFDLPGLLLLVAGLGTLTLSLQRTSARGTLLAAGVVGLILFVFRQRRAAEPLIDLRLFRRMPFVAGGLVVAMQNLSMYALLFQLPFFLEGPMGRDPELGGRVLLAMMATMVVAAPLGGIISERIGVRATVSSGLLLGVGGLVVGLQAIEGQALGPLVLCLVGVGLGLGLVTGPNQAAALSAVPARDSGVASGVLATVRYLGGLVGIGVITFWIDPGSEADALAGHRLCLWVYIAAHAAALLPAMLLPRRTPLRKKRRTNTREHGGVRAAGQVMMARRSRAPGAVEREVCACGHGRPRRRVLRLRLERSGLLPRPWRESPEECPRFRTPAAPGRVAFSAKFAFCFRLRSACWHAGGVLKSAGMHHSIATARRTGCRVGRRLAPFARAVTNRHGPGSGRRQDRRAVDSSSRRTLRFVGELLMTSGHRHRGPRASDARRRARREERAVQLRRT